MRYLEFFSLDAGSALNVAAEQNSKTTSTVVSEPIMISGCGVPI